MEGDRFEPKRWGVRAGVGFRVGEGSGAARVWGTWLHEVWCREAAEGPRQAAGTALRVPRSFFSQTLSTKYDHTWQT